MRPITLPGEEPPDDAMVVARSGVLEKRSDGHLRDSAEENRAAFGFWGLSALVATREEVRHLCSADWRVAAYRKVSLSTVARLRRAGFPILDTGTAPHFDIVLPDVTAGRCGGCAIASTPPSPTRPDGAKMTNDTHNPLPIGRSHHGHRT